MPRKYDSLDQVPGHVLDKLGHYVTNIQGDTFVLHNLPHELTGALMARYSRAPTGLKLTLVNEFLDDDGKPRADLGSQLMNRVLNDFNDESVGELEGVAVGIEDVSQIVTKSVEDRRLGGSPIEQSTRYVVFDKRDKDGKWRYLRPKEIDEAGQLGRFERVTDAAFSVYSEGVKRLIEYFKVQSPRDQFKIEVEQQGSKVRLGENELTDPNQKQQFNLAYNFAIRCAALDVGRCILPSSALTHLGVQGNGRYYTGLLTALKSGGLKEEHDRAISLEAELNKAIPTFIQRNRVNPELESRPERMRALAKDLFTDIVPTDARVTLAPRSDLFTEVLAASLYPYTNISLTQATDKIQGLSPEEREHLFDVYVGDRKTRFDRSGRGLEAGYPITFDLVGGFAEYRDLERHRILTQQRQNLTTELGFIMPPEVVEIGLDKEVESVVASMEDLNSDLRHQGLITSSQYATLFNHRIRFSMGMNLREFQHLGELRTGKAGHFSYRSMVIDMTRELTKRDPWATRAYGFVDFSDPGNKITRANERARIAGKNLASGIEGDHDFE